MASNEILASKMSSKNLLPQTSVDQSQFKNPCKNPCKNLCKDFFFHLCKNFLVKISEQDRPIPRGFILMRSQSSVPARHISEGAAPCPYCLAPCPITQRPTRMKKKKKLNRPRFVHVLDCDRILVICALNCARLCVVRALNCARILVVRALDCAQFLLHPALFPTSLEH